MSVHLGLLPLDRFPALPPALRRSFGHRARQLDRIAGEVASVRAARLHLPMQVMPNDDQFAPDGFHPNAEACSAWAVDVAQRIDQYQRQPLHP